MIHSKSKTHRDGFTLVVVLLLMILLVVVAVGLLGIASVELRKSSSEQSMAMARANARLALMQAINQLQIELGPDQRISAPSSLLADARQKHWTGVWSSRREDGSPIWTRDAETASLKDARNDEGWDKAKQPRLWLVSGNVDPAAALPAADSVELVGSASAGSDTDSKVRVPLVKVTLKPGMNGRLAWWSGDLGQRANLTVADAHGDHPPNPGTAGDGGYFRMLAAQQADPSVMNGGRPLDREQRGKLISADTAALMISPSWRRDRFHDFTAHSAAVLADPKDGGLKKDLTAYFESNGSIPAEGPLAGLGDENPVLVDVVNSRFGLSSPRFGALRDWARLTPAFKGRNVPSVVPAVDPEGGKLSEDFAFSNELPVQIKGAVKTSVQPVLVEASTMMQLSVFQDRTEPSAGGGQVPVFQWRIHNYPRVVLWNPYNVELKMQPVMVMIQGNGRQEVWSEDVVYNSKGEETAATKKSQWLFFEGGRSTKFNSGAITQSEGYKDPYVGSFFYSVPATVFEPGQCLVFSPKRSAEYDGQSVYRPGIYNLASNELSCEVAPDVSRSYYVSAAEIKGGFKSRPLRFWFDATQLWGAGGVKNQSDDTRVVMKAMGGDGEVTFEKFDALPQLAYISGSIQYGAGREPRIAWNNKDPMPVDTLDKANPQPQTEPNVRTRDGLRLRWFNEHLSNIMNSGALAEKPQFFEEALLANWNPRAAYAIRSPWENLAGTMPTAGSSGGPWFFGAYTRDLYDQAVSWTGQVPVVRQGRQQGNPFGPPQEGKERYIVFELPRAETGVISLGQLQHAKISELVWHPSFAIGNSLADPRLGPDHLDRTVPLSPTTSEDKLGGFHRNAIGWSNDTERSTKGRDDWANTSRAMLQGLPDSDHIVFDLSFETNHALWDRYYLSTGDRPAKKAFLDDYVRNPLPNGRMKLALGVPAPEDAPPLANFHRSAYHLMLDGAFNVNSTSVEAWKAMLAATKNLGMKGSPFARLLEPQGGLFGEGDDADSDEAWSSNRSLSDAEITQLAEAIVAEVKLRGPFLSVSDFVNRRLRNDETGRAGALQAAINRTAINKKFEEVYPLDNSQSLPDYKHPDNIKDATRLEQTLKPATKAWGAPGFLSQGDVLQVLGPALAARSDSFVVRGYGEALDGSGKVAARAWCEAVVQRTPEPLDPDGTGLNPLKAGQTGDFGRRFSIVSFRWLRQEEI